MVRVGYFHVGDDFGLIREVETKTIEASILTA